MAEALQGDENEKVAEALQGDENEKDQVDLITFDETENGEKHPLQTPWTLWYFKNDKNLDWETNQREIASFDTVEDFWALVNHIIEPSELGHGCDFSVFRKGIKPMWEDKANVRGGRWVYEIADKKYTDESGKVEKLDHAWLEIMMCLIREAFGETGNYVTGAVCQRRRKKVNKVAVWISTASVEDEESVIYPIGSTIKESCAFDLSLKFEDHNSCVNRTKSRERQATHRIQID